MRTFLICIQEPNIFQLAIAFLLWNRRSQWIDFLPQIKCFHEVQLNLAVLNRETSSSVEVKVLRQQPATFIFNS